MINNSELIINFLNYLSLDGISSNSLKFYKSDLNNFLFFVGNVENINEKTASEFIANCHKNSSVTTINRRLSTLRRFSDFTQLDFMKGVQNVGAKTNSTSLPLSKIRQFDKYLIDHKISKNTRKVYLSDISKFITWQNQTEGGVKQYLDEIATNSSRSSYLRSLSSLKKYYEFKDKNFPKRISVPKFAPYALIQEWILNKFNSKQRFQKKLHKIFFSRPNWYKRYHSYPLANYLHFALLFIFCAIAGYGIYDQLYSPNRTQAYPATAETPNRFLSFQGRLTNNLGNPITVATNLTFKLYDVDSGGSPLWDSTACSITPDPDGIFSTLLGSSCGGAIASSVFSENADVWVGVTVGGDAEATPRIQIATVAYALNSETLQGFPLGTGASTVPYIDSAGKLAIAAASPTLESTSGTFGIIGQAMTISTADLTDAPITINPDGSGTLDLTFEGSAPGGSANGFVNATNASITSGALYGGTVASAATGYNFIDFQAGVSPASVFSVGATGLTTIGADLYVSSGISLYDNAVSDNYVEAVGFCTGDGETNCVTDFSSLGGTTAWNDITDPADNLSLDHSTHTTTFGSSVTSDTFLALNTNSLTTGTALSLASTSIDGGTSGTSKLLNLTRSGTNSNASHSAYGLYSAITNTGTTSINIGGYFSASGATNNYAAIFETGNVGIGTATPGSALQVGSATETHTLSTGDVLIASDLELDGVLYLDGANISNSDGTAFISFAGSDLYLNSVNNSTYLEDPTILLSGTNPTVTASATNSTLGLAANGSGTLTFQSGATGNIQFFSGSNTLTSAGNLTLAGDLSAVAGTFSGTLAANGVVNLGDGGDAVEISGSSLIFDIGGTNEVTLTASALSPSTSNSNALGTSSNMWSDLFLASGGIINWNNGDLTATHSTGNLNLGVNNATNDSVNNILTLTHNTTGTATGGDSDSYTEALLHMDGSDTSTTFTDATGKTWTASGDAQIDTAQSKFGGASGLFDVTDDYVYGDGSADFTYGSGDFTIDFWIRLNAYHSGGETIFDQRPVGTNGAYVRIYTIDSAGTLGYYANSALQITGGTITTGAWHHIALVRSGTSTKLYLDGTQTGSTYSDSTSYINGADRPIIGTSGFSVTSGEVNGWYDELRISKGIARWTSNFTPETSAYSITTNSGIGTGLLFRSEDASGNNEDLGRIYSSFTNATNGSETSNIIFETRTAGGALAKTAKIDGSGNMILKGSLTQSGNPDLAENIIVTDSNITAGDVVMLDSDFLSLGQDIYNRMAVKKADTPYSQKILGVISTDPGIILNAPKDGVDSNNRSQSNERPLTLTGRVPVKIDPDSEPFTPGEMLTASEKPGLAKKATQAGQIIGKSLQYWPLGETDNSQALVYVQPGYYDPSVYLTDTGDLNIKETETTSYSLLSSLNNVIKRVAVFSEVLTANLKVGRIESKLISPIANSDLIVDLQPDNSQTASKLAIKGVGDEEVASIDANGSANFAGQVNSELLTVNSDATISGTLYADDLESKKLKDIEDLLNEVESNQNLLTQASTWETNTTTSAGQFSDVMVENLYVTGLSTVSSLLASDSISLGSDFVIQDNSINTISSTLRLQSLALAPLEFMAGKFTIDTQGNVKIIGNIEIAGSLQTESIVIATAENDTASQSGEITTNATAGKAVLSTGETKIKIVNENVRENTLVYITPLSSTQNKVLFVKNKEAGAFTVGFTDPIDTNVEFNWWIIELK